MRRHRRHRRQMGMTLIDTLIGMALMTTGVAGITYAFSAMERSGAVSTDQSRVEAEIRQLSDFVRSRHALTYQPCATPATYANLIAANSAFNGAGDKFSTSSDSWSVVWVHKSTSATRTVSGITSNPAAWFSCGSGVSDWLLQEIQLKVQSPSRSLTRVVWKGNA